MTINKIYQKYVLLLLIILLVFNYSVIGQCVINEINYRSVELQENIDFVEIYNLSPSTVDLTGWKLTEGINYDFPNGTMISAGGYLVIAADPPECETKFSFSGALGPYTGSLSSNSDNVILRNSNYTIVDKVDYESWKEWPNVRYNDFETIEPNPYNASVNITVNNKVPISIQKINPELDGKHGGSWSAASPTPDVQNSVFDNNYVVLPVIKQVKKSPDKPVAGQIVNIKASFDNVAAYAGIMTVELEYQINDAGSYIAKNDAAYSSNWTSITMLDNGANADSIANDGIYTASLASNIQVNRRLVRYRIKVTTTGGYNKIFPDQNHYESNYSYYVYNGNADFNGYSFVNVNPLQDITVITKTATADTYMGNGGNNSGQYQGYEYLGEGTLIYNGKIFDHVKFRPRGGNSRTARVKPGVKFDLNSEKEILIKDDCDTDFNAERGKLVLSGTWVNDAASHGLVESLCYKILQLTGAFNRLADYTSFRVVDSSTETGNSGDFWGIFLILEDVNGDMLEEHKFPEGNLWVTNRSPRFLYVDTYGDFPNSTIQPRWQTLQDQVVTPVSTELAKDLFYGDWIANEFWGNGESNYVTKHSYREYYNSETDLWHGWCSDYDGAFGSGNNVNAVSTTANSDPNITITQPLNIPGDVLIEYEGYLRSAYDLLLNPEQRDFLVESEYEKIYDPLATYDWTVLDNSRWSAYQTYTEGNIDNQMAWYKTWFQDRASYILNNSSHGIADNNIPDKPTISLTGSTALDDLTFSNSAFIDGGTFSALEWRVGEWSDPANPVYNTKCDPKFEIEDKWKSGEITSFSSSFTFPPEAKLKIGRTYKFRVRYKDQTGRWSHWSDPVQIIPTAALNQNTADLVINEIMYHPSDECGNEFIEIYNNETTTVNLDNYQFTEGIEYDFLPGSFILPGEYIVLAADSTEFVQKYGNSPYGDYKKSLSNNSEDIILEGPFRTIIDSVRYFDSFPWDTLADGHGPSLSLTDPNLDNGLASSWKSSNDLCGTPGLENNVCEPIFISFNTSDPNCNNGSDGFIASNVSGGSGSFTYLWNVGSTDGFLIGRPAGIYIIEVTDAINCTKSDTVELFNPPPIVTTTSKTDQFYVNTADGSASVNVISGGTEPFSYLWNNNETSSTINGILPGTYTVQVSDAFSCIANDSAVVEPVDCSSIDVSANSDNETGFQFEDGVATAAGAGGYPPYSYDWDNGGSGEIITGLSPGIYIVTVTDSRGCQDMASTEILPYDCSAVSVAISSNNESGNEFNDGDALATGSGGIGPYDYEWSNGDLTAFTENLSPGFYSVTATDSKDCEVIEVVQILEYVCPAIDISFNINHETGYQFNDGDATAMGSGGTGPYSFLWENGDNTAFTDNLSPGFHLVEATDSKNCVVNDSVEILEYICPAIDILFNSNDESGYLFNDGDATAIGSGGTGPYSFLWENGDNTAFTDSLSPGFYSVIATDSKNCVAIDSIEILPYDCSPVSITFNKNDESGYLFNDGDALATGTGGVGPYTYLWSNGDTSAFINDLSPGIYSVVAIDSKDCLVMDSVEIIAYDCQVFMSFVVAIDEDYYNANNGSASLQFIGQVNPVSYFWNTGDTTSSISDLSPGNYSVNVTNGDGCTENNNFTIGSVDCNNLNVNAFITDETCFGNSDGNISSIVSGGNPPYLYNWDSGQTTSNINNVTAGDYILTVTDSLGCPAIDTFTVVGPQNPILLSAVLTHESIVNANDGAVDLSVSGGVEPYSYFWSTGESTQDISNLSPANYWVIVSDANGCNATDNFDILPAGGSGCPTPVGISFLNITDNGVTVFWGSSAGVSSYIIEYRIVGSNTWTNASSTVNLFVLNNLNSCSDYELQITGNCSQGGTSQTSEISNFSTTGCAPPCDDIQNLSHLNETQQSVILQWDLFQNANYTLFTRIQGDSIWNQNIVEFPFAILFSLNPCTTYEYYIKVNCDNGSSSNGSVVNQFTTACPAPRVDSENYTSEFYNSVNLNKIKLYPNPVSGILTVETNSINAAEFINVFNATGQLVYRYVNESSASKFEINTTGFEQGVYWLDVRYSDGTYEVEQFIKE